MDKPGIYPPPYEQSQGGQFPPPGSGYPQGPVYPNQGQGGGAGYPPQGGGYGPPPAGFQVPPTAPTEMGHGPNIHFVPSQTFVPIMMTQAIPLGPRPSTVVCPQCKETITTVAKKTPNIIAWGSCGILALLGCVWGCCLIPFCMEPCLDVHHECPNCKLYLGKYSRLQ